MNLPAVITRITQGLESNPTRASLLDASEALAALAQDVVEPVLEPVPPILWPGRGTLTGILLDGVKQYRLVTDAYTLKLWNERDAWEAEIFSGPQVSIYRSAHTAAAAMEAVESALVAKAVDYQKLAIPPQTEADLARLREMQTQLSQQIWDLEDALLVGSLTETLEWEGRGTLELVPSRHSEKAFYTLVDPDITLECRLDSRTWSAYIKNTGRSGSIRGWGDTPAVAMAKADANLSDILSSIADSTACYLHMKKT